MTIEILTADAVAESLQSSITNLYNQLNDSIKQLSLNALLKDNKNLFFVMCKENDTVVGIALMATYKVIPGHKGMIEDVVVDQDFRAKGIGRKLLQKLIEEGKKQHLDELLLFSGHHRTAAIHLYKSLGFQLKDSGMYRLPLN